MERLRGIWTLVIVFLIASPAVGEKLKIQTHYIDPGIAATIPEGEVRCYTFDNYKMLLKVDYDLWIRNQQADEYEKMLGGFASMLKLKDALLESKQAELQIYVERADRLQKLWDTSEKDLAKERNKFSWSSFGIGIGVGGAVVAIIVVSLAVSLK